MNNILASVRMYAWGEKFVVVGEFGTFSELRQEFKTYQEALHEFSKMARREELRYEAGIGRSFTR